MATPQNKSLKNLHSAEQPETASLYFTLLNIYLNNQLTLVFHSLEEFFIVHNHIDTSFLFLLQKVFCIIPNHISVHWHTIILVHFTSLLALLGVFHNISLTFLTFFLTFKKNTKKHFIYFKS